MKSSLNDLEIYREAMEIGESVWIVVQGWDFFAKDTVGKQVTRSADSIAANLAEGYGRYHYKENQKFCYYSRGSAEETQTWIEKAARRALIERESARLLYDRIEIFKKRLNAYIRTIGKSDSTADR
ncbi:MAG: four helix bundle protein [Akkermansiaceae bacterium]|nr:four helix bundle protein [Akkermansiaceae bacterium]